MLVVALKGFFLIAVISCYSVAIMSMINDYFRTEFKEYLKKNPITSTKADQKSSSTTIVISLPTIHQHIENGKLYETNRDDNTNNANQFQTETNEILEWTNNVEQNVENGKLQHCVHATNKEVFLMHLFGKNQHHSYDLGVCVPLIVV